ncbi:sensor histidine kinase [Tardiphaga sp. 20_F10_N6_6]|uniref:sensor histidine kinase n=1 Tax=Tardiphaga sp. 20_F10_N6_6 TaxID=3240788 RepID=UPI003F8867F6
MNLLTVLEMPTPIDRVVLHEITHRINNEFASAIQVVSLASARSSNDGIKRALNEVVEILHSFARVHHLLQMPASEGDVDVGQYLRKLCEAISKSKLESKDIELILMEGSLHLPADRCWILGMIVAELITNSSRHAFNGRGGVIRVECQKIGRAARCIVVDDGSNMESEVNPGSGLRIVDALARSLGAYFNFNRSEDGSQAVLVFEI